MKRGGFVVIDGVGGSGKTTQIRLLQKALGKKVLLTKEPGGTQCGKEIRKMLLRGYGKKPNALTDFFLFWAARVEHIEEFIAPALTKGVHVICDRFDSSTYAFQIFGERCPELEPLFWRTRELVLKKAMPDVYIFLDLSPKEAAKRRSSRPPTIDRFDERDVGFQRRIHTGYLAFAKKLGKRVFVVDAGRDMPVVHADILEIARRTLR